MINLGFFLRFFVNRAPIISSALLSAQVHELVIRHSLLLGRNCGSVCPHTFVSWIRHWTVSNFYTAYWKRIPLFEELASNEYCNYILLRNDTLYTSGPPQCFSWLTYLSLWVIIIIIIIIIFYSPAQHKTNENNNRWILEYTRRLPEKQTLIELATYLVI